jgi:hypothetical protein
VISPVGTERKHNANHTVTKVNGPGRQDARLDAGVEEREGVSEKDVVLLGRVGPGEHGVGCQNC